MIDNITNYLQYLFVEYIGLIIAIIGLALVYSKKVWENKNKYLFYVGYVLLIRGTIMFILRLIM